MKLTPQPTILSTLLDAHIAKCDCVQYKYTGTWVRVEISRGFTRIYDNHKQPVDCPQNFLSAPKDVCGCFIGNYLFDHSRIVLWDCWAICGESDAGVGSGTRTMYTSIEDFGYRDRYALLAGEVKKLLIGPPSQGAPFTLVKNHPIARAQDLWNDDLPNVCGLVFRDSKASVHTPVRVIRRYSTVPTGLE
jgi:hypothetical protein